MTAVSSSVERAVDELADIHKEVYRLKKRIETVRELFRRAVEEGLVADLQAASPPPASIRIARYQLRGHPLKTNPELSARVQQALNLETKREAEIAVGAVVDALEHTLLNNLCTDGFSLKLGGFGKFKVRQTKPTTRRVGFSGKTVINKAKRKIRFVSLGMLRASETDN
jgi:nucleoid DNA-binding protein